MPNDNVDMDEIKSLVEQQGQAFEQFKAANDQRLAQIEKKGASDPVTDEKVEKLNVALTELSGKLEQAQKKNAETLKEIERKSVRPDLAGRRVTTPEAEEHKQAFVQYVRKGNEAGLTDLQNKAMSVGSDAEGGYMVPDEFSKRIVTRVFETTPMRQIATVMMTTSEAVSMLRDTDEAEAAWVGETETRNDTDTPQVGHIRIPVHELHAKPKVTQKLLDDAIFDIEGWLAAKVADKFSRKENDAYINGDGIGKPRGLLTYTAVTTGDATREWGQLQYLATGASGAFATSSGADKLIDLVHALKSGYLQGASWLMPRAVIGAIRKLKETNIGYLWQPGLTAGQPDLLLGFPVVKSEDMPAVAASSLSVAFGNFTEAYTIVDRLGLRMLRDPFTAAPYVRFATTKRTGGDVTNFEAVKLLKFAAS